MSRVASSLRRRMPTPRQAMGLIPSPLGHPALPLSLSRSFASFDEKDSPQLIHYISEPDIDQHLKGSEGCASPPLSLNRGANAFTVSASSIVAAQCRVRALASLLSNDVCNQWDANEVRQAFLSATFSFRCVADESDGGCTPQAWELLFSDCVRTIRWYLAHASGELTSLEAWEAHWLVCIEMLGRTPLCVGEIPSHATMRDNLGSVSLEVLTRCLAQHPCHADIRREAVLAHSLKLLDAWGGTSREDVAWYVVMRIAKENALLDMMEPSLVNRGLEFAKRLTHFSDEASAALKILVECAIRHVSSGDSGNGETPSEGKLQFVHQVVSSLKHHNSGSRIHDIWLLLRQEIQRGYLADANALVMTYLHGTALMQVGHIQDLLPRKRRFVAQLGRELEQSRPESPVESFIGFDSKQHFTQIADAASSALHKLRDVKSHGPSDVHRHVQAQVMSRLREGLRLAMKVFWRSDAFAEGIAYYEANRDMGATWEAAMCYAALGKPMLALPVVREFLGNYRFRVAGAPQHLLKNMLDIVGQAAVQAWAAVAPPHQSETGQDPPPQTNDDARCKKLIEWYANEVATLPQILPSVAFGHVMSEILRKAMVDPDTKSMHDIVKCVLLMCNEHATRVRGQFGLTKEAVSVAVAASLHLCSGDSIENGAVMLATACLAMHHAFPRLHAVALILQILVSVSQEVLAVEMVLHIKAHCNGKSPLATDEATLRYFDMLSNAVVERLATVAEGSTAPLAKHISSVLRLSQRQKQSFATQRKSWTCSYCGASCSAHQKSCHVCDALAQSIWQCGACHGFTADTQPACNICSATRSAAQLRVVPLRHWTCQHCRRKNKATQAFFCEGCRKPSPVFADTPVAPHICVVCNHKNDHGILKPWCNRCGTLHPAVDHSNARLWSCNQCFQLNPWTITSCQSCSAPKDVYDGVEAIRWAPWHCATCDGATTNAPWSTTCAECGASRDVGGHADTSESSYEGALCSLISHREVTSAATVLRIAGHPASHSAPVPSTAASWVCLRSGCLHQNAASVPRCGMCQQEKGLTTRITRHTNILRFEASPSSTSEQDTVETAMERLVPATMPGALEIPAGSLTPTSCGKCGEMLDPHSISLLCSACFHSGLAPTNQYAELALWLYLKGTTATLTAALNPEGTLPLDTATALSIMETSIRIFQTVRVEQLPWRGRDIVNMECCTLSAVPTHSTGTPHSTLLTIATLISFLSSASRERETERQLRKRLLIDAMALVDIVNASTDFDELSFEVMVDLVESIELFVAAPGGEANSTARGKGSWFDTLRLEYLLQMKLPTAAMVPKGTCRWCLECTERCSCPCSQGSSAREPQRTTLRQHKGVAAAAKLKEVPRSAAVSL